MPLEPTLHIRDHENQAHQQAPWSPSGRSFRNRQNTRVDCLKILQANFSPQHWGLCNRLRRLPSFEISKTQALWLPAVLPSPNALMERLVYGFCYWITSFNQLERQNLWLNPSYRRQAHKNGSLWASQGNYQCPGPSGGHYGGTSAASWPFRLNCQWSRLGFHLEILVIVMLRFWDQA